jgi:hypothetical protein
MLYLTNPLLEQEGERRWRKHRLKKDTGWMDGGGGVGGGGSVKDCRDVWISIGLVPLIPTWTGSVK